MMLVGRGTRGWLDRDHAVEPFFSKRRDFGQRLSTGVILRRAIATASLMASIIEDGSAVYFAAMSYAVP